MQEQDLHPNPDDQRSERQCAEHEDTIHFLKKHGIHPAQVNLLPYHNTGSSKYPKLGMEYKGTDLHAPEKEEMESFVKLFQDAGYTNTKIGG